MTEEAGSGPERVSAFTANLERHRERVRQLRRSTDLSPGTDLLAALGELDVAYEELRVADEEMKAQQQQIEELLALTREEQQWRGHVGELLPVPVLTTNAEGMIDEANAAAAMFLHLPLLRLTGKPLASLVDHPNRPHLRRALSRALATPGGEWRLVLTMLPRRGSPVSVSAAVLAEPTGPGERKRARWVFLPRDAQEGSSEEGERLALATAAALAELSTLALHSGDRLDVLARMAQDAQAAIPEADAVTITLGSPLDPRELASDSDLAQSADGAQLHAGEGPCLDAYVSGQVVVAIRPAADARWPRLAAQPGIHKVGSVLAVPVLEDDVSLGVLNIYAHDPDAFGPRAVRVAELVASSVSAALQGISQRDALQVQAAQLAEALKSRAIIDQAKGIVMSRYGGTADEAFRRMSVLSQRSNIKLRDIARLIVEAAEQGKSVILPPT